MSRSKKSIHLGVYYSVVEDIEDEGYPPSYRGIIEIVAPDGIWYTKWYSTRGVAVRESRRFIKQFTEKREDNVENSLSLHKEIKDLWKMVKQLQEEVEKLKNSKPVDAVSNLRVGGAPLTTEAFNIKGGSDESL